MNYKPCPRLCRGGHESTSAFAAIFGGIQVFLFLTGVATAESLDNWHVRESTPNASLFGVAYGNGTWVVTSGSPDVFTSPNGATWTRRVNPVGGMPRAIAFGANTFVTCGFDGRIMTSPDGITWTQRDSPRPSDGSQGWGWSVLHANGLFVALAGYGNGLLVTSPDGINWTRSLEETNRQWRGLAYGNGVFVAAGPYLLATSSNGLQWTRQDAGTNFWPASVTFGNGKFVGVGAGSAFTSSNGVNWTKRDLIPSTYELYNVTFGDGVFVALDPPRRIWSSTDGENWTPRVTTTAGLLNAAYAQGRFVAVGGSQIWQSDAVVPTSPLIVRQPVDRLLRSGRTYTNRVVVESVLPVRYQWQLNGTDIAGATNDVFIVPNAPTSLSGQHSVIVANDAGSEVSTSVHVLIANPPTITVHPLSQEVPQGGTVTLSVSAAGNLPLSFRWRKDGSTVAFFQVNQSHSFLTLTNIQVGGEYTVAVSPTRFYQFSDRIEIQNPGGLYGEASPENFPRVNAYRNPIVAEAMHVLGYVNRFGRGIARAQRFMNENGSPEPCFEFQVNHFLAIIPKHTQR